MGVHVYVPVVTHKWLKTNKNHVCRPALKKGKVHSVFLSFDFFIRKKINKLRL